MLIHFCLFIALYSIHLMGNSQLVWLVPFFLILRLLPDVFWQWCHEHCCTCNFIHTEKLHVWYNFLSGSTGPKVKVTVSVLRVSGVHISVCTHGIQEALFTPPFTPTGCYRVDKSFFEMHLLSLQSGAKAHHLLQIMVHQLEGEPNRKQSWVGREMDDTGIDNRLRTCTLQCKCHET